MKEKSFAMEMLNDYKRRNRVLIFINIALLLLEIATAGYLIYILNDIETEQTITETYEMEADGNNTVIRGDNNGEITY